jgi:long-chain acyl-CoA synthetase
MYRKWHPYYDPGVPYTIPYPQRAPRSYFTEWVKKQPNKVYLIHGDREIAYQEANSIACKLANSLIDLGYQKQDRIALMAPNIPEYVLAQQACFKLNAIMVPTNPAYTSTELTHQFQDSGTETVIVFSGAAAKVIEILQNGDTTIKRIIVINSPDHINNTKNVSGVFDFYDLVARGADHEPDIEADCEDVCMLQYTGGTTGVSKGCVLTNANIEAMAWIDWYWFGTPLRPLEQQFRCLVAVPVYHIYGFNCNVNLNLIDGGTLILVDAPTTDNLLLNINKHKPNFFFAVPAMIIGLNNHPDTPSSEIKSIQGMMCGSSPLAVDTINKLENLTGAKVCEGYGMSETSNIISVNAFGATKPGTVGFPLPDTDVRVVDLETGTIDVTPGEPGELICTGPQNMREYWNNPQETANTIRDGWLYTGDIVSMDEKGYITILDRKKDMCLCSGFNVFPREIDEVLYGHPKVFDTCSVGIPDPKRGETIKAFVILKPGETMTEQEVIDYCRQYLTPYKVPTAVAFIDELPRTNVGKPMRVILRDMERAKAKQNQQ